MLASMTEVLRLRRDGLDWREIDGEIVALEVNASLYLASNGSGAVLWRELACGATRDRLVDALRARWIIDTTTAERDVDAFLDQARRHGLLE
jgi:hypothetical protein